MFLSVQWETECLLGEGFLRLQIFRVSSHLDCHSLREYVLFVRWQKKCRNLPADITWQYVVQRYVYSSTADLFAKLVFAFTYRWASIDEKPITAWQYLGTNVAVFLFKIYRVSQEEWTKLRESVPYVILYRYNPKHLYPKLNGYGDNSQRKVWTTCISAYCTSTAV